MKKYREPWLDRLLQSWAAWVVEYSRWVGWGGGADDPLADVGWARGRTPGSYANPVLAEATWHQRWAGVHAEIMGLPTTERRVIVARYCGRPVPFPRAGHGEDLMRVSIDVPPPEPAAREWAGLEVRCTDVTAANRHRALQRMAVPAHPNVCWLEWRWSGGPLPFATIAQLLDLAPSTCHEAIDRAKIRLEFRLEVRRSIRSGLFSPDGVIDPAKLDRAREATHRGETWKEQQEQEERDAA